MLKFLDLLWDIFGEAGTAIFIILLCAMIFAVLAGMSMLIRYAEAKLEKSMSPGMSSEEAKAIVNIRRIYAHNYIDRAHDFHNASEGRNADIFPKPREDAHLYLEMGVYEKNVEMPSKMQDKILKDMRENKLSADEAVSKYIETEKETFKDMEELMEKVREEYKEKKSAARKKVK
jgi:hypothetical protein